MGLFGNSGIGKFFNKVGNGVIDVVKATHAQPIVDAVKNSTGKQINIQYSTGVGKTVATGMSVVGNTSSAVAKNVANGVTMNMATKVSNSWRAPENRDGDGSSFFGKYKGGFAEMQQEAQDKYDQDMAAQYAAASPKSIVQAGIMASQVGVSNMPSAAVGLLSSSAEGWFHGKFWDFVLA